MARINIAIDGPAGAGKSTIAKMVAKELNILYLDTGAMYRAMALFAIEQGVDPTREEAVNTILPDANVEVQLNAGVQSVWVNGRDVTPCIRTARISKGASDIAVHPEVRKKLVELQRRIALQNDVVMDGRDIGTFVLPDAKFKFYLDASPRERARRRLREMQEKSQAMDVTLQQMEHDIVARDHTDGSRAFAPMRRADDACLIDSTELSIGEVVRLILDTVRAEV